MHALPMLTTILSAAYLVSMMFALGLELGGGPKESKEKKRAKRRTLVRGLLLNLVVFPAVAFGIARALHASGDVAIALMLLAAVPGGRYGPHLVKFGGGDVALAVEVTLFLAKLTAFTAAPTAKWMLTLHTLDVREVPLILQLVLLQLLPLYGGKWLRRKHRALALRVVRPAHTVAIATMLAVFATVLLREDRGLLHLLGDRSWIAVGVVGVAWPVLGWLLGGRGDGERRSLAITANARELALALLLASLAFPDRRVQTAIFGIWSIYVLSAVALAAALRGRSKVRAGGPEPGAPVAARSARAH
jgi:BASS family bile acid:Na+ symporter